MIYNFEELSFQILTIDRYFHTKGVFRVKARPYAALSFRVSGTGEFEIDGRHLSVNPGDVMFIPADMPYRVEYSESESLVVHLKSCNYEESESFCVENPAAIALMFGRLLETWRDGQSVNRAKSIIYNILEKIQADKQTAASNAEMQTCMRYIEAHAFDPALKIEDVCNAGFLSRSSLQRVFRESMGMSPKQYLIKLRMDRALSLLIANQGSVKEIATACGFPDEKYFSRAFKKTYGYPPSRLLGDLAF